MSKNIKRDEKGHPILNGAILYKYDVRPKGKRVNSFDLKVEASNRLVALMKEGSEADRLSKKGKVKLSRMERDANFFNKQFSESAKIVQLVHYNNKMKDLQEELKRLEDSGNARKLNFMGPAIQRQIAENKKLMDELYLEIRRERLILSKNSRGEDD